MPAALSPVPSVMLATGETVKLGRVKPPARPQVLMFREFLDPVEGKPAPASINYLDKATASIRLMLGNDQYGCCVFSGKGHAVGIWSGNDLNDPILATTQEVVSQYLSYTGGRDNGAVITEVLGIMRDKGLTFGGQKRFIDGYVGVDNRKPEEVKVACLVFGGLCIGFNVPSQWMNTPDGGVWDNNVPMNFVGGHDVQVIDYDAQKGVRVSTWGGTRWITWRAFQDTRIVDECYAILSPNWYNDDKLAPNGINVQKLKEALTTLGGGDLPPWEPDPVPPIPVPPIPVPPPPPPPPPPPVPVNATVSIPKLNVRVFGLSLGSTDPVTVPVSTTTLVGVSDWRVILTDLGKLFTDAVAGNWGAVFQDVIQLLRDFGVLANAQGFGPVVPWSVIIGDVFALLTAVMSRNWAAAITAILKLGADFGFNLTREQLEGAIRANTIEAPQSKEPPC